MKCKSCEGEVPPKFSHAIAVNTCPFCGEEIMESALQEALVDLKSTMSISSIYPDEVFDWLKSNYNLVPESLLDEKIKESEAKFDERLRVETDRLKASYFKPVPKSVKAVTATEDEELAVDKDGNQIGGESIQAPEQTNKFMKNAGVNKMVAQNNHYKKIVNEIKRNGAPALMSEGGSSGVINPEMLQALDVEETEELQAYFGNAPGVSSGLDNDYDDDDGIPSAVLAMANQAKQGQSGSYNAKDAAALAEMHKKARKASNALNNGGSVGLIKR